MKRAWVIAYDITKDRRRTRVAKRLEAQGIRLQKSVFLVTGSPRGVRRMVREIGSEIDPVTDCVCAWPMSVGWEAEQIAVPPEAAPLRTLFVIG
ncbi:MAG: CRISPR-associated endonuclease Cas2 [Planctomycetaceae bacterium]|nr:MAG: CRISPR-associated endonuclease Cas2 [Planctomycetaceae bacterium]